jgi:hypothetical protein
MSKAQSGSLKVIDVRAPALGACPSDFHSVVPERRMDSSSSPAPVPLTSVKFEAPAIAGALAVSSNARKRPCFMRGDIHPRMKRRNRNSRAITRR